MSFKFFPHTEKETKEMLNKVGIENIQDLFADIPEVLRFKGNTIFLKQKARLK